MKRFAGAFRGEWKKIFTTRSWWILGLVMILYVAFTAGLVGALVGLGLDDMGVGDPGSELARYIYTLGPTIAYLFPVLIGALSVTSEYRHHTLGSTFVWNGSRNAVLAAKVTTQLIMGMLYGIAALAAAVLSSAFFLAHAGFDTGLGEGSTWLMFLRAVVAMGIWATIGVGIGILVRNQAAAIVIVIVFTQFIEPIARMAGAFNEVVGNIVGYLPGAASDSFTGASFYSAITSAGGYDGLSWWAGGLVLAGYAALVLVVGWLTRWRADVD